ncbi:MAG: hypothetical protein NT027_01515 [Proteobacteria bacterium]|nr:hypothetical protein [Pseudomonadota bacterium]
MGLQTRQLIAINATLNPDRQWITQQICNAEMSGYKLPSGFITDNDGIFGKWLGHDFQRYFDKAVLQVIAISKKDAEVIREIFLNAISKAEKILHGSKEESLYALIIDFAEI